MKKKLTVAGIALTLILLIPMLYSTIFIKSMMDPYGNIDKLPVALVENQSTNRVYTALKESNVFDFTLTNHEKAVEKLKQGKVYAIIEFESDFMNKLSEFPAKQAPAEIKLTTGEGLNYSSAKIISSAVDKFVLKANNQTASSMVEKLNQEKVPIPANISEVIQLKHEEYYPVKNNGEAMAPYILSLTLFVGSIFLNQFVMRIFKKKANNYSSYWRKQYLYPLLIVFGQSLLLAVAIFTILNLHTDYWKEFMLFIFLASGTFYSVIVSFNKLFPGIGSLLVLIITMLQTSSSGGSYSIYLASPVFQTIHRFIPMTYSVDGFRKLLSLDSTNIRTECLALFIFLGLSQLIIYLAYWYHEKEKRPR
ncbi:YhgE/Pip domain-containing protein [Enterococcus termitis]|uniref:ABC-2 type transporter transmembrane domain-containing protein n=1 Tax=Enterococcus termitis TaxID=332950 RepID=A0A1E5GYJ4_9ENTE|nr:YhgE/Pip family protein [Enterococcus termitis]OEG17758.1 hypothetical protein BCR25_17955 [Enterococcus termitis]OJG96842.1 hypothetical protein RV18_GL001780 [Enterococcus termitis]